MTALVSGGDGLDALRIIVAGAPARLASDGFLIVEHGYDQSQSVGDLFAAAGFVDIECDARPRRHSARRGGSTRDSPTE